jgi:ribosomal protein L37E
MFNHDKERARLKICPKCNRPLKESWDVQGLKCEQCGFMIGWEAIEYKMGQLDEQEKEARKWQKS